MTAAAAWAEAVLELGPSPPVAALRSDLADELVTRFRLEPLERRLLDFVVGVERSLRAGRRLLDLGGRARLTVGIIAAAFGAEAEAALGGRGRLREHGLLTVAGLPAGTPGPTDVVGLAPGLAARLAGSAPGIDELGPGIQIVTTRDKPTTPEAIATVVREQLVDVAPGWVTVSNAGGGDTRHLAEALSHRLQRPAVVVDGSAVARLPQVWELLAAIRRECDLADASLFLEAASSVGGAWRALAAPAPQGRPPKPIVLVNAEALPARPPAGFVARAVTFVAPTPIEAPPAFEVPAPPAPVPAPPAASAPSATPSSDPLEIARRRAAEDAARALGKPVPGTDQPIRAAVARAGAAPVGAQPASVASAAPPASVPPSPAAAAPRPAEPRRPASRPHRLEDFDDVVGTRAAAREAERQARAAALSGQGASGADARRRFEELAAKARARSREDAIAAGRPVSDDDGTQMPYRPPARADAAPRPPSASAPSSAPPVSAAAPVPAAAPAPVAEAAQSAGTVPEAAAPDAATPPTAEASAPAAPSAADTPPDPAEALPFVPVSDETTLPDLIRLASTAPNPRQRAELIRRLVLQAPKDVQVLKLLRALANVPQPLVRAAAEEGLATIFGPGWSRTRAIPKPAQPPRSD